MYSYIDSDILISMLDTEEALKGEHRNPWGAATIACQFLLLCVWWPKGKLRRLTGGTMCSAQCVITSIDGFGQGLGNLIRILRSAYLKSAHYTTMFTSSCISLPTSRFTSSNPFPEPSMYFF